MADSLMSLMRAVTRGDAAMFDKILTAKPGLAKQTLVVGATREVAACYFFPEIGHYLYGSDTALHAAAAGYREAMAREFLRLGSDVRARNRRGGEPLHYAADGSPESHTWNPNAQAAMVALLIGAGADPNALDKSGVAPLHRAVRQRCTGAVKALLQSGADVNLRNKSGTSPLRLSMLTTGRGGSGRPASKACQQEIRQMLLDAGARPE
jgi:hypothetical protein